jgi:hypothetical protein
VSQAQPSVFAAGMPTARGQSGQGNAKARLPPAPYRCIGLECRMLCGTDTEEMLHSPEVVNGGMGAEMLLPTRGGLSAAEP